MFAGRRVVPGKAFRRAGIRFQTHTSWPRYSTRPLCRFGNCNHFKSRLRERPHNIQGQWRRMVHAWSAARSLRRPPGQLYGTASRNSIPGPGLLNASASLSKTFLIGESNSLELRGTAANVFNAVQYSAVNTQFDSPTVGQVTATQPMRQLTFPGQISFLRGPSGSVEPIVSCGWTQSSGYE
jgi:hypothetical protein